MGSFSNTIVAYKILKDLTKPYNEFEAYDLGIIGDKGELLKSPNTSTERSSYDAYTKMILNLRRILQRFIGTNPTVNRLASLFLLKEGVDQETIDFIVKELSLPSDTATISDIQATTLIESTKAYF